MLFRSSCAAGWARLPAHDRRELHARAATWLAWNGHPVEAMPHAVAAEEWSFTGNLVADHWVDAHLTGSQCGAAAAPEDAADRSSPSRNPAVAVAFAALHLEAGDQRRPPHRALALAHGGLDDAELDGAAVSCWPWSRCCGRAAAGRRRRGSRVALGGLGAAESAPPEQRAGSCCPCSGAAELWSGALDDARRAPAQRRSRSRARWGNATTSCSGRSGTSPWWSCSRAGCSWRHGSPARRSRRRSWWASATSRKRRPRCSRPAGRAVRVRPGADAVLERAAAAARGSGDDPLRLAIAAVRALGALAQDGGARHGLSLLHAETAELGDWGPPVLVDALLRTSEIRCCSRPGARPRRSAGSGASGRDGGGAAGRARR
jgi:hypothetical protein